MRISFIVELAYCKRFFIKNAQELLQKCDHIMIKLNNINNYWLRLSRAVGMSLLRKGFKKENEKLSLKL